ncbi:MAG: lipoyl domain-containing protein, partial [Tepidiformaceae bacterium]
MGVVVEVPDFGEGMGAGLVAEWYHGDGADAAPGEPVCRVECAFVAFEIEATGHGLLRHQKPAGSLEPAGAVLGVILAHGEVFSGPGSAVT